MDRPERRTFQALKNHVQSRNLDFMRSDTTLAGGGEVVDVLLPLTLDGPYSYAIPSHFSLAPGDYVRVPLGPRQMIGVVWAVGGPSAGGVEPQRLRPVLERYDQPPMGKVHRKFVDWVAAYNMVPSGAVLRMCLRVPSAFGPPATRTGYRFAGRELERMTPQRTRVLEIARDGMVWRAGDLAQAAGVTPGVVRSLVQQGALVREPLPPFAPFTAPRPDAGRGLSRGQEGVARKLRATVAERDFSVTLLDGVTGSGKTEVYFEAMASTLAAGRQVLLLLPEIALTGEFIRRVEGRFGARPAEWHSGLRPSERERAWRGVTDGSARMVVGARSALFLPYRSLGLIVVDEEHETAFKQEEGVIYHARDMAVVYGSLGRFPVVLSSATPSLESLVNIDRGRYRHVTLGDRHGRAELPRIETVDMRSAPIERGRWLSQPLSEAMAQTLAEGEQVLLFLNRRGYAPLTLCRACGFRLQCVNCDSWLVEHRFRHQLMCHQCGHSEPVPNACPSCGAEGALVPCGPGVERLAEEVAERFPEARLAILSSDLTRGASLPELLRDIAAHRLDVVIGTQLVAKGHHFPQLTLVGVVDADLALGNADPRAAERTHQLLVQVAGRAGRGDRAGRALIQTHMPDHPLMQALEAGDRNQFIEREKRIREEGRLPPYGRLAAVIISGKDQVETGRFARRIAELIPDAADIRVFGPSPAPLALVRGRYRFRFLVQAGRDVNIQAFMRSWLDPIRPRGSLRLVIDIDPYSFM